MPAHPPLRGDSQRSFPRSHPPVKARIHLLRSAASLALVTLLPAAASAQTTYTWTGGGSDSNWSTAGNWSGSSVPSGDSGNNVLVFSGTSRPSNNNNLGNWSRSFGQLYFASGAASFTLGGNSFGFRPYLGSGLQQIFQDSANTQTIAVGEFSFRPDTDSRINLNAGDLVVSSTGLFIDSSGSAHRTLYISGTDSTRRTVTFSGNVNKGGTGLDPDLIIESNKRVLVTGSLAFGSGNDAAVFVRDGVLQFSGSGGMTGGRPALGASSGSASAALWLDTAGATFARQLELINGSSGRRTLGGLNTSGVVTFSGDFAGGADSYDLAAAAGGTAVFSGSRSFTSALHVNRADGASTYAGTVVLAGTTTSTAAVTVHAGTLQVSGSAIATGGSPGALGTGAVSVASGARVTYWLSPSAANTVANTFTLAGGELYTRDGANTYSGNLTLSSGTSTVSAQYEDVITLSGGRSGAGNLVFAQAGDTGSWSAPTFVLSGVGSNTGTVRVTGSSGGVATRLQLANVNALQGATLDLAAGDAGGVEFTVAGANTYNLGGLQGSRNLSAGANSLAVGGNGSSTTYSGNLTLGGSLTKSGSGTLTLTGANTISGGIIVNGGRLAGDTGSLQGAIANFATLEFAQASAGTYAGVLSGTGLVVKTGAGTLTLTGDNTFTGGLRIEAGTVLAGLGGKRETLGGDANTITFAGVGATLRAAASVNSVVHGIVLQQDGVIDTNGFNLSLDGTLAGDGGLIKLGAGTLELGGTGVFTGALAVNQGTVIVTAVGALRSGADVSLAAAAGALFHTHVDQTLGRLTGGGSAGGVADLDGKILSVGAGDATFAFDGRLAGSNASQFHKVGAGTLTLTNTATNDDFTGSVKVSAGSLRISAVESLGKRGTSRTLYLENGGELSLLENLSFNTRIFRLGAPDASGAGGVFRVASGKTATLGGLVADDLQSGSGALVKDGAGTLVLEGGNTYAGGTVIRAGTLVAGIGGNRSTLGADSGDLTFDGVGATLRIAANVSGSVRDYHYLQTGTIDTAGFNLELNGASTGAGGLTKTGLGTLTLGGAQGHTGLTAVSAGKLVVNGTLAGSATVDAGAILGGSGTIAGDVTVAGTHSPGNSPGIQTIQGNLTYAAASALVWELSAQTDVNSPLAFDQIVVGGDLTFAGATSLSLVFNATGSAVDFSDPFWSTARTWTLFDVTGNLAGLADLQIASVSADSTGALLGAIRPGSTFSLSQLGSDIQIAYTPVPEPSTYGLLLGALALATSALRRRRKS